MYTFTFVTGSAQSFAFRTQYGLKGRKYKALLVCIFPLQFCFSWAVMSSTYIIWSCRSIFLTYCQSKDKGSPSPKPGCTSITPCSDERLNEESFKANTKDRVMESSESLENSSDRVSGGCPPGHFALLNTHPVLDWWTTPSCRTDQASPSVEAREWHRPSPWRS